MELTKSPVTDKVKVALADRDISGSALARDLGLSQAYVSRRLRGVVPWRVGDLERIARYLDIPIAELLADAVSQR